MPWTSSRVPPGIDRVQMSRSSRERMRFHIRSVLVTASLWTLGCGSNDSSAEGSLGGVSGSAKLADLSSADQAKFCAGFDDAAESELGDAQAARGTCLLLSTASAQLASSDADGGAADPVAACEAASRECTTSPKTHMCPGPIGPSCALSVADVAHCLSVEASYLRGLGKLTCAGILDAQTGSLALPDTDAAKQYADCNAQVAACFGLPGGPRPVLPDAGALDAHDGGPETDAGSCSSACLTAAAVQCPTYGTSCGPCTATCGTCSFSFQCNGVSASSGLCTWGRAGQPVTVAGGPPGQPSCASICVSAATVAAEMRNYCQLPQ